MLPDAATQASLARFQSSWMAAQWPSAGQVALEDLHLTLAFLGDCSAEACARVCEALDGVVLESLAQCLPLRRIEVWGRGQRVCVAVYALQQAWRPVLDQALGALERCGWHRPARSFRPHVTLWRHGMEVEVEAPFSQPDFESSFQAARLTLMASAERSDANRYRVLYERRIPGSSSAVVVGP